MYVWFYIEINFIFFKSAFEMTWVMKVKHSLKMSDTENEAPLTRFLKNSWMEFLFSSFLGTLAALSPAGEAADAGLLSTTVSGDFAAGLGSSLVLTGWGDSAVAGGAGVVFLGSAA